VNKTHARQYLYQCCIFECLRNLSEGSKRYR